MEEATTNTKKALQPELDKFHKQLAGKGDKYKTAAVDFKKIGEDIKDWKGKHDAKQQAALDTARAKWAAAPRNPLSQAVQKIIEDGKLSPEELRRKNFIKSVGGIENIPADQREDTLRRVAKMPMWKRELNKKANNIQDPFGVKPRKEGESLTGYIKREVAPKVGRAYWEGAKEVAPYAVGFGTAGLAGAAIKKIVPKLAKKAIGNFMIPGALGGMTRETTDDVINKGRVPTSKELLYSAGQGAIFKGVSGKIKPYLQRKYPNVSDFFSAWNASGLKK